MTSQYKKTSPKGKGQGLTLAGRSKMTTKQIIVYVYGEDKGWKITPTSATSHYGVEVSKERLLNMAVTKLNNPYAE